MVTSGHIRFQDSRDSVFSVSTNATEDYAASEQSEAKTLSRQSSTDMIMSDGEEQKNRVRQFWCLFMESHRTYR